jgi:hypothetical protein
MKTELVSMLKETLLTHFKIMWHVYLLLGNDHSVQTGSGAQPTSCPTGIGAFFPDVKRPEREANHIPPSSADVKSGAIYTSTPPYVSRTLCLIN